MSDIGGALVSGLFGIYNNSVAERRESTARRENFALNELSAENADKRTRALYYDLYSPQAQMQQIKEAGLSPSLFYGNLSGMSGQSGTQGAGAGGINPNVFGIDPLTASQIMLNEAQVQKTKSETKKADAETNSINLQNTIDEYRNYYRGVEFELTTTPLMKEDGQQTSLYEIATNSNDYDTFVKEIRNAAEKSNRYDLLNYTQTEIGQSKMREIFMQANRNERDINVLSAEYVDAQFKEQVTRELMSTDFAKLNAKDAIQRLETNVSQNELTNRQKEAWLNLLRDLEKRNKTAYEIVVILGMLVNRFAGQVSANVSTKTVNKNYHAE